MVTPTRTVAPLAGTTVVDFTRFVSGSYCTMLLAALGAEVVKVEVPPHGDSYRAQGATKSDAGSTLFESLNRGKKSVLLDFRTEDGLAALEVVLAGADFFVHNSRPGSLDGRGLGYDDVHARHPQLVYASISAFGDVGPDAERGGFDLIVQAESGIMSLTGTPESGPVKVGAPLLDIGAGLSTTLAILAAHIDRMATGVGSHVSSSLLEFALAGLTTIIADVIATGEPPPLLGSHSPTFSPYGAFATSDGHIVLAGAGSDRLWPLLCELIGRVDLIDHPGFIDNAQRITNRDELTGVIEASLAVQPTEHWLATFAAAGLPASTVRSLHDVLESEQLAALGQVRPPVGAAQQPAVDVPFRLAGVRPRLGAAPELGTDTAGVLDRFGVGSDVIERLLAAGQAAS